MRRLLPTAAAMVLLIGVSVQAQRGANLPDGPGVEVVRSQCLVCHQTDLIEQQRLPHAGWTREVAKMERWGARLTDPQREALIAYLTTHFGARPRLSRTSLAAAAQQARGEGVLQRACRPCHGTDPIGPTASAEGRLGSRSGQDDPLGREGRGRREGGARRLPHRHMGTAPLAASVRARMHAGHRCCAVLDTPKRPS